MLGFLLDTETNTLSLGHEKLEKARCCLASPLFDWGCRGASLKDLQVLMGRLHHWSVVCRPAQVFTSGLLRLLSVEGTNVRPGYDFESEEEGWNRLWADLACLRLIFDNLCLTSVDLTAPFLTVLEPEERLRLSHNEDRMVVLGTDATEWSVAAVLFGQAEGLRIQLPESVPAAIAEATATATRGQTPKGRFIGMAITESFSQ